MSAGTFLGLDEKKVALPLNRISVAADDDELLMRGVTEEEIEATSTWRPRSRSTERVGRPGPEDM